MINPTNIITKGLDFGKTIITGFRNRRLDKFGSQENREQREHETEMAQINSYMKELQPIGSWVDALNRIPRPLIAFSVIAYLYLYVISPEKGAEISRALQLIPSYMWYIISGVIGFYFTFRTIDKAMDKRKKLSQEQFDELKYEINKRQDKINENVKGLIDINNDGIDDKALNQLKKFEGWRNKIYKCSAGYNTIGWGTNLDAGIDKTEGEFLLSYRFKKSIAEVNKNIPWIKELNIPRRYVVYNMAYNMGWGKLSNFKKFLSHLEKKMYRMAAAEMKNSAWYNQTGIRARKLVNQMKRGKYA